MPEPKKQEPVDESVEPARFDSSWAFVGEPPTVEQVTALLAGVHLPHSTDTLEQFLPYVLPMSNNQKVKVQHPSNPNVVVDEYVTVTTLYTQVAGRIAMLTRILEGNGWSADIYPEPMTPTGVPGYLKMDDRLVFRVYVDLVKVMEDGTRIILDRRFGTASAKAVGGSNAEGTNPFETVETSALGRALGQHGIGILPGSGVASAEEMRLAKSNMSAGGGPRRGKSPDQEESSRETRQDLIAGALSWITRYRDAKRVSEAESDQGVNAWCKRSFGLDTLVELDGTYRWDLLKDAQIRLLRNAFRDYHGQFVAATTEEG